MYELWDARSLNMIDCYGSACQAETALGDHARRHGQAILDDLFLLHEDEDEVSTLIAEGQAMLVAIERLAGDERTTTASRRIG